MIWAARQQKAAFEKKIAGQVLKAAANVHESVAAAGDDKEEGGE